MDLENSKAEIQWNDRLEEYLSSVGEKALCYAWLHKKAEALFSWMRTFIDLPVIILSVVTGATSIGSESLFGNSSFAPVALGIVSLFVSILNTVGSYFSWARRAEAHRISSIQYSKMYRFLKVELSLPRLERINPNDLLKYVRSEYDRMTEISPLIPVGIIKEFKKSFPKLKDDKISEPEETNGLEKIEIFEESTPKPEVIPEMSKLEEEIKAIAGKIDLMDERYKDFTGKFDKIENVINEVAPSEEASVTGTVAKEDLKVRSFVKKGWR